MKVYIQGMCPFAGFAFTPQQYESGDTERNECAVCLRVNNMPLQRVTNADDRHTPNPLFIEGSSDDVARERHPLYQEGTGGVCRGRGTLHVPLISII